MDLLTRALKKDRERVAAEREIVRTEQRWPHDVHGVVTEIAARMGMSYNAVVVAIVREALAEAARTGADDAA